MWRPIDIVKLSILCILLLACNSKKLLIEIPKNDDFINNVGWALTRGGKDGDEIRVTNLNLTGAGSFLNALQSRGKRKIVFEVSGVIDFKGRTPVIKEPYLSVCGQTALGSGITIVNGGLRIATHDVIIQHIRIRPGDTRKANNIDGLSTMEGAYNVVIDHCSFSWAIDENLSASGPRFKGDTPEEWRSNTSHNITFSHNIIAEGLYNSKHTSGVGHSMGTLIHDNVTNVLIYGNLYYCNNRRNPIFKGGTKGVIANNYIYNPGEMAMAYKLVDSEWKGRVEQLGEISVVGNVMERGLDTRKGLPMFNWISGKGFLYMDDNRIAQKFSLSNKELFRGDSTCIVKYPTVWIDNIKPIKSTQVKKYVLENAGAFNWNRDVVDRRIIQELRNQQGKIINTELEVGGLPN